MGGGSILIEGNSEDWGQDFVLSSDEGRVRQLVRIDDTPPESPCFIHYKRDGMGLRE